MPTTDVYHTYNSVAGRWQYLIGTDTVCTDWQVVAPLFVALTSSIWRLGLLFIYARDSCE
jgi:hypothetical protein